MILINENYARLRGSYLFSEMAKRINAHGGDVIRLGIGDVTCPLPPAVIEAMKKAVDDMGSADGFHGYGPEQGYAWLREAIAQNDYAGLASARMRFLFRTAQNATQAIYRSFFPI